MNLTPFSKPRYRFYGDVEAAQRHAGDADLLMYQVRLFCETAGVPVYALRQKLLDGTVIEASRHGPFDEVRIWGKTEAPSGSEMPTYQDFVVAYNLRKGSVSDWVVFKDGELVPIDVQTRAPLSRSGFVTRMGLKKNLSQYGSLSGDSLSDFTINADVYTDRFTGDNRWWIHRGEWACSMSGHSKSSGNTVTHIFKITMIHIVTEEVVVHESSVSFTHPFPLTYSVDSTVNRIHDVSRNGTSVLFSWASGESTAPLPQYSHIQEPVMLSGMVSKVTFSRAGVSATSNIKRTRQILEYRNPTTKWGKVLFSEFVPGAIHDISYPVSEDHVRSEYSRTENPKDFSLRDIPPDFWSSGQDRRPEHYGLLPYNDGKRGYVSLLAIWFKGDSDDFTYFSREDVFDETAEVDTELFTDTGSLSYGYTIDGYSAENYKGREVLTPSGGGELLEHFKITRRTSLRQSATVKFSQDGNDVRSYLIVDRSVNIVNEYEDVFSKTVSLSGYDTGWFTYPGFPGPIVWKETTTTSRRVASDQISYTAHSEVASLCGLGGMWSHSGSKIHDSGNGLHKTFDTRGGITPPEIVPGTVISINNEYDLGVFQHGSYPAWGAIASIGYLESIAASVETIYSDPSPYAMHNRIGVFADGSTGHMSGDVMTPIGVLPYPHVPAFTMYTAYDPVTGRHAFEPSQVAVECQVVTPDGGYVENANSTVSEHATRINDVYLATL